MTKSTTNKNWEKKNKTHDLWCAHEVSTWVHIQIRGTNMRLLKRGIFKPVSEMFLLPVNKDKNGHCQ